MNKRHGGPWDRGSADAWYGRPKDPHYYKGGTGASERVEAADMTPDEIAEYTAGYDRTGRLGLRQRRLRQRRKEGVLMKYGVLRPSLMVSDEALVLSTHDTLDAAMTEQTAQCKQYGWAYAIVRRLKAPVTVGEHISLRQAVVAMTHADKTYPHPGGCLSCRNLMVCNYCGTPLPHGRACTNGRCAACHQTICTPGGSTSPGHGYGKEGT